MRKLIVFIITASALSSCAVPLKEAYKDDFLIGGAIGSRSTRQSYVYPVRQDRKELEVLAHEFNCITAENVLKWEYLQPRAGFFNFDQADEFVTFAEGNNLAVVGHVLVWHSQLPDWVLKDVDGNPVSREVLIDRMRDHIHTVVGRYKGRIKYWDVVNEAIDTRMVEDESLPLDDEGNPQKKRIAFYRDSPWRQIIGDDYIELAFRFAHEADPEARLLYNDYSMAEKEKAELVAEMVRGLKAKSVPVHGVGMQGHWHLDYPAMEELQAAIDLYVAAGVKVSITELDVGLLPRAHKHRGADISELVELQEELNPYTQKVPSEVLEQHVQKYRDIFTVLLNNRDSIERVTFWGVSDKYSWLNNHPVRGRTAYPLLFDRNFKPKRAYYALKELADEPRP